MLRNYIRVALRNLLRHKGFTFINVLGLSSSMSICLLIILFLLDQNRSDEFNSRADSIYRVLTEHYDDEKERIVGDATSPIQVGELVALNFAGAESTIQLSKEQGYIRSGDKVFSFNGLYTDQKFFDFFQWELQSGDPLQALRGSTDVVISKKLATNLFGEKEPLGQLVTINGESTLSVVGVVDPELYKSHLRFDILLSSGVLNAPVASNQIDEHLGDFYNYIKIKDSESGEDLGAYLSNLESEFTQPDNLTYTFGMQRLDQINLALPIRNEIGITTPVFVLYFLIVMGLVVMLSASFNYMNLSIARALKRAKEVGVRKVIGAGRRHIIIQFLVESQMVMLSSLVIGVILLEILIPAFNELKVLRDIDGAITLDYLSNFKIYAIFIGFALSIGTVAGLYPALYLSSFKPISALKGSSKKGKSSSVWVRKSLLFIQYSFSIIFIITAIVLRDQSSVFINTDYGFDRNSIMNIPLPTEKSQAAFNAALLNQSSVKNVSTVSGLPALSEFPKTQIEYRGNSEVVMAALMSADDRMIDNLRLELIAGRNFIPRTSVSPTVDRGVIINQSTAIAIGYEDPYEAIDKKIRFDKSTEDGSYTESRIIGVLQDFNYEFIFRESGPLIIENDPSKWTTLNIKFNGDDHERVAASVETVWRSFDNMGPFEYHIYEAQIADLDDEFMDLVILVGFVALFAVVIASLGQFSMVVHHIELKIREIGIRKVLGSEVSGLMYLLSKEFLTIIILATLCATPLAWKINMAWTNKLAVHPEVSFASIGLGLTITFALALITILTLVGKAALSNPVKSLKYEG